MRTILPAVLLAAAIVPATANADVQRCATADTDLAWTGTDIAEISGDTGWFPSGYVAQLRLSGRVMGHTAVETGVRTQACWGEKMQATLAGRPGGGFLDVSYGAEVSLKGRIHTSVLGRNIDWEGNIPLPYIPMDLLLEAQTTFDPTIDATKLARVSDATAPITLLTTDLIGDYISIIGISGGLRVTVTASMATTFRTKKATVAGGTIDSPGDKVTLQSDGPRGFGGGFEVPIQSEGVVRYEPRLLFGAGLHVTILGIRVVDWTLISVPMGLPALERTIKLTGESARLALPVLEGIGEGARMDFASGTVQELPVRNLGEAVLSIEPKLAGGALISRVDIPPGGQDVVKVFVADDAAFANGSFDVTLATNDPDRGDIKIQLGKQVGGTDPGTPPDDGEPGGCSAGGSSSLMLGLLGLVAIRRRRRAA
ncbi:MAG: MYXO-CTERM sorting domain-containing protein [Myxococcota bacterium]|nr:MYXO-CTERM sorting domain-containing protein [Myxococcota bacterium]